MNTVTDYTQDGLSLANVCPMCIEQEQLCVDCVDAADARLTDKAYALVDEGNTQYRRTWSRQDDQPSGSDWIASETYVRPRGWFVKMTEIWSDECKLVELSVTFLETDEDLVRHEFLPPVTNLQDGGVYEELWELDDLRQYSREVQCKHCNLRVPRTRICTSCDHPTKGGE